MSFVTAYNEKSQALPFSLMNEGTQYPPEDPPKKEKKMENDVAIFQFKESVPKEYIDFLNNPDHEIGPMREKILEDGTYKVVIYYRKPQQDE